MQCHQRPPTVRPDACTAGHSDAVTTHDNTAAHVIQPQSTIITGTRTEADGQGVASGRCVALVSTEGWWVGFTGLNPTCCSHDALVQCQANTRAPPPSICCAVTTTDCLTRLACVYAVCSLPHVCLSVKHWQQTGAATPSRMSSTRLSPRNLKTCCSPALHAVSVPASQSANVNSITTPTTQHTFPCNFHTRNAQYCSLQWLSFDKRSHCAPVRQLCTHPYFDNGQPSNGARLPAQGPVLLAGTL